jgi:hypothetical protein
MYEVLPQLFLFLEINIMSHLLILLVVILGYFLFVLSLMSLLYLSTSNYKLNIILTLKL